MAHPFLCSIVHHFPNFRAHQAAALAQGANAGVANHCDHEGRRNYDEKGSTVPGAVSREYPDIRNYPGGRMNHDDHDKFLEEKVLSLSAMSIWPGPNFEFILGEGKPTPR